MQPVLIILPILFIAIMAVIIAVGAIAHNQQLKENAKNQNPKDNA